MPPAASASAGSTSYFDAEGNEFDLGTDNVSPSTATLGASSSDELTSIGDLSTSPPSPPLPTSMLSDDGAPPLFTPGEMVLYLVVSALALCCMWSNFKPQILKCLQCVLEGAALCPPLQAPAQAAMESLGLSHSRIDPLEDPEIVWTNEAEDPLRVDGSEEIDAELLGSDVVDGDADGEPEPRRGRGRRDARPKKERKPRRKALPEDEVEAADDDDEEALFAEEDEAEVAPAADEEVEAVLDDEDEVEEVDDDDGDGTAPNAMSARLGALEAKLRCGGTVTLNDLQGTRARVSGDGDFLPGAGGRTTGAGDDSFTMVGLSTQVRRGQQEPSQQRLRQEADRRQAKLEEALREKKENAKRRDAQKADVLKREARRKLQKELLFMDHELDALTGTAGGPAGGPPSQVLAAKWLLEHAYTKHPPPSFTKRRAAEEAIRARELRFRDAATSALKLMQARYSPNKNTVGEYGAEWAVISEEISKHAFSLCAGISRGSAQELPPLASGSVFARSRREGALDDEIDFSLAGEMDHDDDVEDAD